MAEAKSTFCEKDETEAVVRASLFFASVTAESIAQAGDRVTLPQLRVLVLADVAGPLNNSTVARALNVHISNASRLCERLVQGGFLSRRDSPSDRRTVELRLTDLGASLVASVTQQRRAAFARIMDQLNPRDRATVSRGMVLFADAAETLDTSARFFP